MGFGKRWWRQATGLSNAQRQLSRKLGIPLSRSGRRQKMRRMLGPFALSDRASGCARQTGALLLIVIGFCVAALWLL